MKNINFFIFIFASLVSASTDEVVIGESNLEQRMARLETAMDAQSEEYKKMADDNKNLLEENHSIDQSL